MTARKSLRRTLTGWLALILVSTGCDGQPSRPAPATNTSAVQDSASSAPAPANDRAWTREESVARLTDSTTGVSAAIQLVRLSGKASLAAPPSGAPPRDLKLVSLSADWWGLGRSMPDSDALRAPVLIRSNGEVELPFEGFEEELGVLQPSADPERFPHVFVSPIRIRTLKTEGPQDAVVCANYLGTRFIVRRDGSYAYVALLSPQPAVGDEDRGRLRSDEAARYDWDGYESVFMGPAMDVVPGRSDSFEIDLSASGAFVPVGGRLPVARHDNTPRPPEPPASELGPF